MGLLEGKKILITGIASERSIAYGIAKSCFREGAKLCLTYASDRFEGRLAKMALQFGDAPVYKMDATDEAAVGSVFERLAADFGKIDGVVHAIAFAPREAIEGEFLDGCTREAFATAMDVSVYTLAQMMRKGLPILSDKASVVTLSYLGAERFVEHYNTMGVAKAALEAEVRYLAGSLGPKGIRVNAVSAGPVRTLSSAAIENFSKMLHFTESVSPLRRCVTTEEIGNLAAFLLSDYASAVTGETIHADAGYSIVGAPFNPEA